MDTQVKICRPIAQLTTLPLANLSTTAKNAEAGSIQKDAQKATCIVAAIALQVTSTTPIVPSRNTHPTLAKLLANHANLDNTNLKRGALLACSALLGNTRPLRDNISATTVQLIDPYLIKDRPASATAFHLAI